MAAAAELARSVDARLLLVSVVPPYVFPIDVPSGVPGDMIARHVEYAEGLLAKSKVAVEAMRVPAETKLLVGSPAPLIAELAEGRADVDLVVVGRTGAGLVARALVGSTADRIVHSCHKPVLVIP